MLDERQLTGSTMPCDVHYSAQMHASGRRFTVYATGHNRSTGYKTFLQVDPALILPAQLDFVNIPPSGPAGKIVLPFRVELTMAASTVLGQEQKVVVIHDAEGSHAIPIQER